MAVLTTAARKRIPADDFVFPKTRKFPIEDAAHARDALSRAGAKGGAVEAKVDREVHEKYPGIGKRDRPSLRGAATRAKRKGEHEARKPEGHHTRIADIFSHR